MATVPKPVHDDLYEVRSSHLLPFFCGENYEVWKDGRIALSKFSMQFKRNSVQNWSKLLFFVVGFCQQVSIWFNDWDGLCTKFSEAEFQNYFIVCTYVRQKNQPEFLLKVNHTAWMLRSHEKVISEMETFYQRLFNCTQVVSGAKGNCWHRF